MFFKLVVYVACRMACNFYFQLFVVITENFGQDFKT